MPPQMLAAVMPKTAASQILGTVFTVQRTRLFMDLHLRRSHFTEVDRIALAAKDWRRYSISARRAKSIIVHAQQNT